MNSTRHLQMLLVLFVALCHGAGAADAEDGLVIIGGTAAEDVRATAMAAVEAAVKQAGWSLTTRRLSMKETDAMLRCAAPTPFSCLPPTLAAGGIHRVLIMTVEPAASSGDAAELALSGKLIVTSSRDFVVDRRFCESCAGERLAQGLAQLAEDLLRQLATQSGRTKIEIKSEPAGAQILLDGARIGVTDASFTTYPGKHLVTLERDGYFSETTQISADEGETTQLAVMLRASLMPVPRRRERRSRLVPGTVPAAVMAAGAVVVLGGIVLYAVDQDPSPSGGKRYWDTAPAGVLTGVAGLAVSAAGAYLWWRGDF